MLVVRAMTIGAVCVVAYQASGDILYTNQDRHIESTLSSGIQRRDAIGFMPFNDNLDVQDVYGRAILSQNSVLDAASIEGDCFAYAISDGLLGFAQAECRLLVEFDLSQPSTFILDGVLDTSDPSGFSLVAFFRFDGPDGNIVNMAAQPPSDYYFDFSGENAITGTLPAGHYRLDAELNPAVQTGTRSAVARLDFTLTIPAPAGGAILLASLPLLARRRRRRPENC